MTVMAIVKCGNRVSICTTPQSIRKYFGNFIYEDADEFEAVKVYGKCNLFPTQSCRYNSCYDAGNALYCKSTYPCPIKRNIIVEVKK